MIEAHLYQPIIAGMLADHFAVYKIADGSFGKKPFDIGGMSHNGLPIGCEVKAPKVAEAHSLPWALFERHQVAWLRTYAAMGGLSLACVYCRHTKLMHTWVLTDANDRCERVADYKLTRFDGKFRGWQIIAEERKLSISNTKDVIQIGQTGIPPV